MPGVPAGDRRGTIAEIAETLRDATHSTDPGGIRTIVLSSGPGTGKSYTLRAFANGVDDATVHWATADELSWRQPYAVAAVLLGWPVPEVVDDGYGDELYAEVDALCARGPQLLVLDDAHNADAASLSLMNRLVGAADAIPLTLLIARRKLPARDMLTRLLARPGVREWTLPPMDADDLSSLCRSLVGAPPAVSLRAALDTAGGNPMHARSLLETLLRSGRIQILDGQAVAADETELAPATDLKQMVAQHLALLDGAAGELIQKMAVWGGPVTLVEMAGLDNSRPAKLVSAAQTAHEAGVINADSAGTLTFTHDLYAEVTYDRLIPALRSVLHRAIAEHHRLRGATQLVAHHLIAAGNDGDEISEVTRRAVGELDSVPGVAADLLGTASGAQSPRSSGTLPKAHIELASALARTGRLTRAADVAAEGLRDQPDRESAAALQRILFLVYVAQGRTDEIRQIVDAQLAHPLDPATTDTLTDVRNYASILDPRDAVPAAPFFDPERRPETRSVLGLMSEALRRFLRGDAESGLQLALIASRRHEQRSGLDHVIGSAADVWPTLIEGYLHGPAASADLFTGTIERPIGNGAEWVTAYRTFNRGGIELASGHLDDAAASFDTGFELTAAADMSWTSMAVGGRTLVDVWRGDFVSATGRLARFVESGEPEQFGLPVVGRARALLLEGRRQLGPAADVALETWTVARSREVHVWLPTFALDAVRIGIRAKRADLVGAVAEGLAAMPSEPTPVAEGPVELTISLATAYPTGLEASAGELATIAARVSSGAAESGDAITAVHANEEAAWLAALAGNRELAREHGNRALARMQEMSATSMSTRLASRLRSAGVRMDPVARRRPRTGWESLTTTERTVAGLLAAGNNGPEIADELYVSTRTVQTHVSHALTKLGLRTRVELAAYVAAHQPV